MGGGGITGTRQDEEELKQQDAMMEKGKDLVLEGEVWVQGLGVRV